MEKRERGRERRRGQMNRLTFLSSRSRDTLTREEIDRLFGGSSEDRSNMDNEGEIR